MLDAVVLMNRLTLGAYFLLAGVRKLLPAGGKTLPEQWQGFAKHVVAEAPSYLPEFWAKVYGYALPPVELVSGLFLILGLFSRIASGTMALMLLSFLLAVSAGQWWPDAGPAFPVNLVLLTLALWLTVHGPGRWAIKGKK